jgi:hypothetical protein
MLLLLLLLMTLDITVRDTALETSQYYKYGSNRKCKIVNDP